MNLAHCKKQLFLFLIDKKCLYFLLIINTSYSIAEWERERNTSFPRVSFAKRIIDKYTQYMCGIARSKSERNMSIIILVVVVVVVFFTTRHNSFSIPLMVYSICVPLSLSAFFFHPLSQKPRRAITIFVFSLSFFFISPVAARDIEGGWGEGGGGFAVWNT